MNSENQNVISPNTEMPVKHGVQIKEHRKWNTKTIYNEGHVMMIYRRQPKLIHFRSPMINDFNQNLCGGWSMPEIPDENAAIVDQLIHRRKPFGYSTYYPYQHERAIRDHQMLMDAGLVTKLYKESWNGMYDHLWRLDACYDIKLQDIGDLDDLHRDYEPIFKMGIEQDTIAQFANMELTSFIDITRLPLVIPRWMTGLVLGYPVENTISLYLQ